MFLCLVERTEGSHGSYLGDEAVTASHRRLEPPTVQPRRIEHALAQKSRVFICECVGDFINIFIDRIPKLEIEYYVSWHLCFLVRF
jgi:hypothetical protein